MRLKQNKTFLPFYTLVAKTAREGNYLYFSLIDTPRTFFDSQKKTKESFHCLLNGW